VVGWAPVVGWVIDTGGFLYDVYSGRETSKKMEGLQNTADQANTIAEGTHQQVGEGIRQIGGLRSAGRVTHAMGAANVFTTVFYGVRTEKHLCDQDATLHNIQRMQMMSAVRQAVPIIFNVVRQLREFAKENPDLGLQQVCGSWDEVAPSLHRLNELYIDPKSSGCVQEMQRLTQKYLTFCAHAMKLMHDYNSLGHIRRHLKRERVRDELEGLSRGLAEVRQELQLVTMIDMRLTLSATNQALSATKTYVREGMEFLTRESQEAKRQMQEEFQELTQGVKEARNERNYVRAGMEFQAREFQEVKGMLSEMMQMQDKLEELRQEVKQARSEQSKERQIMQEKIEELVQEVKELTPKDPGTSYQTPEP